MIKSIFSSLSTSSLSALYLSRSIARLFCLMGFLLGSMFKRWHITSGCMLTISSCLQANTSKLAYKNLTNSSNLPCSMFLPTLNTLLCSSLSTITSISSSVGPAIRFHLEFTNPDLSLLTLYLVIAIPPSLSVATFFCL